MDTTELLREVKRATRHKAHAEEAAEQARARHDEAVRAAMLAKVSVDDLIEETGLTRGRLYQIRAGRRTLAKES